MERYKEYKDSGVQWLGEIPGHWDCVPLKRIIRKIESGVSANGSTTQFASGVQKGVLKTGCVSFRFFNPIQNKLVEGEECNRLSCPVKKNTIIVSRMNTPELVGSCAYVETDYPNLYLPDRLWQVHFIENNSVKYLHWLLNSNYVRNRYAQICVGSSSTMQNISQTQFSGTIIPLPPLPEQQSIVSYLDTKCAMLDKMLEGKQKQMELLQEMKQRMIADAVTRGLNPDVKMKATGIAWLPEIPEHWELRKMKYLFTERSEKNHPDEPMLSATQTEGVILQSKYKGRVVVVNTGFEGLKLVKVGDFVIHLRSFQGGIEIAHDQGIISSAYTILSLNNQDLSGYYRCLFKSIPYIDLLKTCVTGIREGQNINYTKLKQNLMPLPPLPEQRAIVSYIQERTAKIDTLTAKLQQEVETIKEYKQRLISDVVTGQIKVC